MRIVDCHVHMDRMAGEDILRMAWGGVEVGVIPTPHLMSGLFYPQTLIELWDKTLGYMIKYAASMGVDCYVGLSVPFYGLTAEGYDECLKKLPEYLKEDRVDFTFAAGENPIDGKNATELYAFTYENLG